MRINETTKHVTMVRHTIINLMLGICTNDYGNKIQKGFFVGEYLLQQAYCMYSPVLWGPLLLIFDLYTPFIH